MTDTDKLRKAAMAATKGPRSIGNENNECCDVTLNAELDLRVSLGRHDGCTGKHVISREQMLANARFIVECDPDAILELLDEHAKLAEFASAVFCEANHAYASSEDESMVLRNLQDCGLLDSTGQPVGEWHKVGGGTSHA